MDASTATALLEEFNERVLQADPVEQLSLAHDFCTADLVWRGPHPINELRGPRRLVEAFHAPLTGAFPDLARCSDVSFAGTFGGATWVTTTGYYRGTFTGDWLGIPATGRPAEIRFGEFVRVSAHGIAEACVILDLPDLMRQAGCEVLPPSLGASGRVPGPGAGDGIIRTPQDAQESERTLRLVEAMVAGLLSFDGRNLDSMGMERFWHPDMVWHGPSGIGSTRGLDGFRRGHQGPFLTAFPDRTGGCYASRVVEGRYLGICGWPSIRATHAGPYLGTPATHRRVTMRVLDWWAREGDLLRENWVLIDLVDLFLQMDVDLFARMHAQLDARHSAGRREAGRHH